MNDWGQDLKFGWRVLLKSPGLSLIAVLSLALAIGANTAIFTVWNAVLLHGVAVHDPARLLNLYTQDSGPNAGVGGFQYLGLSYPNYQDYARNTAVFSGLSIYQGLGLALTYQGQTDQVNALAVSGNYFEVLGVNAAVGRVFSSAETANDGQGALVVLSNEFFHRRFGGGRAIIGQNIALNGHTFMVAGVAPASFHGTAALGGPEVWVPLSMHDVI